MEHGPCERLTCKLARHKGGCVVPGDEAEEFLECQGAVLPAPSDSAGSGRSPCGPPAPAPPASAPALPHSAEVGHVSSPVRIEVLLDSCVEHRAAAVIWAVHCLHVLFMYIGKVPSHNYLHMCLQVREKAEEADNHPPAKAAQGLRRGSRKSGSKVAATRAQREAAAEHRQPRRWSILTAEDHDWYLANQGRKHTRM